MKKTNQNNIQNISKAEDLKPFLHFPLTKKWTCKKKKKKKKKLNWKIVLPLFFVASWQAWIQEEEAIGPRSRDVQRGEGYPEVPDFLNFWAFLIQIMK